MNGRLGWVCAGLIALTVSSFGQGAAFEAVSIKPNTSGDQRMSIGTRGRTYTATNAPIRPVIAEAFDLSFEQDRLVGGPAWLVSDRFDIHATIPEGAGSQWRQMLQRMLTDRFHLAVHRETRDAPMFALMLARGDRRLGPGLRQAATDCDALRAAGAPVPTPAAGDEPVCSSQIDAAMRGRGQRIATLARMLTPFAGRQVVDRTELPGGYDFDLKLPEENAGKRPGTQANDPDAAAGGIFTAVQDELGLKLQPIRAPVEFVVIDRVERPTAD